MVGGISKKMIKSGQLALFILLLALFIYGMISLVNYSREKDKEKNV